MKQQKQKNINFKIQQQTLNHSKQNNKKMQTNKTNDKNVLKSENDNKINTPKSL